MPCLAAPFIAKRLSEMTDDFEAERHHKGVPLPWQPVTLVNRHVITPLERINGPPKTAEELEDWRLDRDELAEAARARYAEWREKNPPPSSASMHQPPRECVSSVHRHSFRSRDRSKELGGPNSEWSSASKVKSQQERIDTAVTLASSLYLTHPPYPKRGPATRNFAFSHLATEGYDFRTRERSKELSACPILRVRPRTESERINEAVDFHRARDVQSGSNWSIDHKYGNPPSRTPTSLGLTFRKATPERWVTSARTPRTPRGATPKWRGNFVRSFAPEATARTDAQLRHHHSLPFRETLHDSVAVHSEDPRLRPRREAHKEASPKPFTPLIPSNVYLPNPSKTCTWNAPEAPATLELREPASKSYLKHMELPPPLPRIAPDAAP